MPVLEAMACGTPVIASNVSTIPEVAGGAALTVNPKDVDGLVKKIDLILNDEKLKQVLIKKGLRRVKEFTWETTANKTLEVYESL